METVHVQLEPKDQKFIIAVFSCEQDLIVYPNQATISVDDPRWRDFWAETNEGGRASFPSPPEERSEDPD